jgi:hypothetical protein
MLIKKTFKKIKKMGLPLIQTNNKCEVAFYIVCICKNVTLLVFNKERKITKRR